MIVADGALAGRTAAVTGASSGIGLATAARLRDLGASVTALARRRAPLDGVRARSLDVTDAEAARAAFAGVDALDVLVAAAGTNLPGRRLGELHASGWDAIVATNLSGVFHAVDAALPALRRLRSAGVRVGVVTNQSGVARGLLDDDQVRRVNARVEELLGPFDVWMVCPHGEGDG